METTQRPTNKGMGNLTIVHIYNGIPYSTKINKLDSLGEIMHLQNMPQNFSKER